MSIEFNGLSSSYRPSSWDNTQLAKKDIIPSIDNNSNAESPLTEAIRLYRNFTLTGVKELTSEEKEEIKSHIESYLKENNILERYRDNKLLEKDYAAINNFLKDLHKQFGSKAGFYEFVSDFVEGTMENAVDSANRPCTPFKVEVPPEYKLSNIPRKPMFMPFHSLSPHQFLTTDDSSE